MRLLPAHDNDCTVCIAVVCDGKVMGMFHSIVHEGIRPPSGCISCTDTCKDRDNPDFVAMASTGRSLYG